MLKRDGDRLFTPSELGTFRSGSPPGTLAVTYDPGIGHPYSDDTSVALERQLGNIGTRTAFVYKRSENNYTNIEQARLGSFYTDRRTAVDPGVDGIVGTGDDGTFSYWDIPAGFVLPPSRAIRTTRRDNESRTKNIDFTVAKRMSSRWSLVGNFLYTWSYSHSVVQNPNQELDNPQNTTLWTFKLFGTYMAPWDLAVTPVLRHQAGDPLVRNLQITTRVGSTTFPVEPIGTYREDNVTIFDTRLERRFRFNGRREVGLFFDAFNIFNSNAAQSQDNIVGRRTVTLDVGEVVNYQRFLRPTVIIGPRVYRLGFKIAF